MKGKVKVAVATVDGKAYFLIVNALKERNIPFISIIPGQSLPLEVKAAITTEKEKALVEHQKVIVFSNEQHLDEVISETTKVQLGKKTFDRIIIGIDPGEIIGLAAMADGKIIDKENCSGTWEVNRKIKSIIKNLNLQTTEVIIKIGNGVSSYRDIVEDLDILLPLPVVLEIVNEHGTNGSRRSKRSRLVRHISSASKIAMRSGYIYPRRRTIAANS
jgi:hypothetical protein